jgi:tetratricopeptide (TPR) repeat protein
VWITGVTLVTAVVAVPQVKSDGPALPAPDRPPAVTEAQWNARSGTPPTLSAAPTVPGAPTQDSSWRPRVSPSTIAGAGGAVPPNVAVLPNGLVTPDGGAAAGPLPTLRQTAAQAPAELPPPRTADPNPGKTAPGKLDEEAALLLSAARNAANLRDWDKALSRFEKYFRRYGDDPGLDREVAGILVQAGQLPQALKLYQDLLQRSPDDADLRNAYADLAVRLRDYRQAAKLLTPALERDPANREVATRLARAFVFMDDVPHAWQLFDQYLATMRPTDDQIPEAFPALLVDLERPGDALAFLAAMLEKQAKNVELRATLVRALARRGERARALAAVADLAAFGPEALTVRLNLAATLTVSEDYEVAAAVYGQILEADAANTEARIGMARVEVHRYQPVRARALLEGPGNDPALQRRFWQVRAEYHQTVGEFADAKVAYERLLHENENDHEVRLSLAALYEEPLREDERARAEFGKIPASAAEYRHARVGIAAALTNQRHFPEAAAVCKSLLAEFPSDGNAVAMLAHTLARAREFDEAVRHCRAFLEANARNVAAVRTVRLALGKVLLEAHHAREAAEEFEQVLTLPGGRVPFTFYGLARAAEVQGGHDKARDILGSGADPSSPDARYWILLSDLYSADDDDHGALEMARIVLHTDPDNLAAQVRVVTAQSRLARQSGRCDETVQAAQAVLTVSPTNFRARLEMARALASAQQLPASVHAYEELIAIDSRLRLPRLEHARVLHSDHQFSAAQAAYQELLTPPAEALFHRDLDDLGRRDPQVLRLATVRLPADLSGQLLKAELTRPGTSDPEAVLAFNRVLLDYQARAAEQAADRLEAEAKDKDWRHREVIPVLTSLLSLEPANTAAAYDLGQTYSNLCQTHHAIDTYAQEVQIDVHEREAALSLERATLELAPQGIGVFDFFNESGRQGLADITRVRLGSEVRIPYGDEDEYFSFGFSRVEYLPRHDSALEGNILSGGFQAKACDRFYAFGLFNLEDYPDRLKPRLTFDTGLRYDFCDLVSSRADLFLNNVVENGETLRQDIYRYGAVLRTDLSLSRRCSAVAAYTFGHYSDDNDYNDLYVRGDYILWFPPGELKVITAGDLQGYRSSTMFRLDNPDDLDGVVHPYYSPRFYAYYESRVCWKQWLSRDYAAHSNQCWYSLEYALGWDNSLNCYNTLEARFFDDLRPWLSVGAHVGVTLSSVYNAQWASVYVIVRWPWCH